MIELTISVADKRISIRIVSRNIACNTHQTLSRSRCDSTIS
jgi:hypothetical protein